MKVIIGLLIGLAFFVSVGWFFFPWVFTTVKGLFENSDLGTLAAIVALIPAVGVVFALGEVIGMVALFVADRKR